MKLKHLLLLGSAFLASAGAFAAETITVDGSLMSLPYESGDMGGKFFDQMGQVNSSMTYNLNVTAPGDYVMYLQLGNKLNAGQVTDYEVTIDGEVVANYIIDHMIGGNWNNFMMCSQVISFPEGELTLTITQKGDRSYISQTVAPYLVPTGYETAIGEEVAAIDLLHMDSESTDAFNVAAAFGVDNSGYGDRNNILVAGKDYSGKGTKMQGSYPKSRFYYLVNVAQEGDYPVTAKGFFVLNGGSTGILPDYPLCVKAYWKGRYFAEDVITGFEKVDDKNSQATGTIHLPKGIYMLEISTTYTDEDLLSLASLTFGVPEEGDTDAEPVGKFVPTVSLYEPENASFGHEFTLNGLIGLDQEDDEIAKAIILLGEEELGELVTGEGNAFEFDVTNLELFPTPGEYTFNVEVATERGYKASGSLTVDLQKKVFQIEAFANAGGSIEFEGGSEKVAEGDDITVIITPNEGYEITGILVDNEPVEFTVDDSGVATYTFENVTSNMMIEATFAKIVFSVEVSVTNEGGKIEAAESVEYGDSVIVTVTPDNGFKVSSILVNGESVDFNAGDNGVVTITVENVTGDLTVSASFSVKETNLIENVSSDSLSISKVNGGVLISVANESSVVLYDLSGNVLFNGTVSGTKFVECNVKGIVLLTVNGIPHKVVL